MGMYGPEQTLLKYYSYFSRFSGARRDIDDWDSLRVFIFLTSLNVGIYLHLKI